MLSKNVCGAEKDSALYHGTLYLSTEPLGKKADLQEQLGASCSFRADGRIFFEATKDFKHWRTSGEKPGTIEVDKSEV